MRSFRGFQDMFFQSLTPHIFWYSFVKANFQARLRASLGLEPCHKAAPLDSMAGALLRAAPPPPLRPCRACSVVRPPMPAKPTHGLPGPCPPSGWPLLVSAPTEGLGDAQVLRNLITQKQNKPFKTTIKTMVRAARPGRPARARLQAQQHRARPRARPALSAAAPRGILNSAGLRAAHRAVACSLAWQLPPGAGAASGQA